MSGSTASNLTGDAFRAKLSFRAAAPAPQTLLNPPARQGILGGYMSEPEASAPAPLPSDFIRDIVASHVAEHRYPQIVTRFRARQIHLPEFWHRAGKRRTVQPADG
jgi:hypothetical protein